MNTFTETPIIEHLTELKKRLVYAILAFLAMFGVCFYYAKNIYGFLVKPLAEVMGDDDSRRMIYTGLTEAFLTYVKLAMFAGFILSLPIILYQIYAFVAPGLYKKEKKFVLPFLFFSILLFLSGAGFVYYFLIPNAWKFFLSFEAGKDVAGMPILLEARVSEYLSLIIAMILAFGITFQLPIILIFLCFINLISVEDLKKFRKYAFIIILIVAAFLTPPDVFSQIIMTVPLYLLYEISILISGLIKK